MDNDSRGLEGLAILFVFFALLIDSLITIFSGRVP
jgi:hypothetical protein